MVNFEKRKLVGVSEDNGFRCLHRVGDFFKKNLTTSGY